MSGGSHNYVYSTIKEELVGPMHDRELDDLMQDIADLAHDLEWADSGDYSPERYKKAVEQFKSKWFSMPRAERLRNYIDNRLAAIIRYNSSHGVTLRKNNQAEHAHYKSKSTSFNL